jgi:hypothetical protein
MKIVFILCLIIVLLAGAAACSPGKSSPASPSPEAPPVRAELQTQAAETAIPVWQTPPDWKGPWEFKVRLNSEASVDLTAVSVSPSPGAYLANSENVSSRVLLTDVQVNQGISDKQYISPWYPAHKVNSGDPVLVVSGSIQNQHQENKEIAMYAEGYDAAGKQVAWTLDAAHIAGQIGLHLEKEATGRFTLHLNLAEDMRSIRIFANNYSITPP